MPTLEEELEALKGALSLLQNRHISDIQQLSEQILQLQQQIDEQKKRSLQFPTISQGFLRLEQKIDQQTSDIKKKFDASDHFATRTWGLAQEQERDIREIKGYLGTIDNKLDQILTRLPSGE